MYWTLGKCKTIKSAPNWWKLSKWVISGRSPPLSGKKSDWKQYYIRIYANKSSLWSMVWRISLYTQPSNTTNLLIFLHITSPHSRVSTFISVGVRWENYTCVIRYSNSSDLRLFGISQLVFNKEKKSIFSVFSFHFLYIIILYVRIWWMTVCTYVIIHRYSPVKSV